MMLRLGRDGVGIGGCAGGGGGGGGGQRRRNGAKVTKQKISGKFD